MKKKTILFLIFTISIVALLPIFLNPNHFLNRNNDLQEFFWPIIEYEKRQILTNHTLPLWNTMFLSGTPLLPNPQSMLFYVPNIIFLFLPMDVGFLISTLLYVFLGAVGIYLVAKELEFTDRAAFTSSTIYILSPRLFSYLEAGHFGLIASWGIIPFIMLAIFKVNKKPKMKWAIFLSFLMFLLYQAHLITFAITAFASLILLTILKSQNTKMKYLLFILSALIAFGLLAIVIFPQFAWSPETTRNILIMRPDTYPKWATKKEFIKSLLFIVDSNTEKIITIGLFPFVLAVYGFMKLKHHKKIIVLVFIAILLISQNNVSPIYSFLISMPLYRLLRVSTRFWFIISIAVSFLCGYGINIIKNKRIAFAMFVLVTFELLVVSWNHLQKPIKYNQYAPIEILNYISKDKDIFRVYCTTHCISQRDLVKYNLETIEGYDTVQQTNYYQEAWQLTGYYWNYYTLSIPPFGEIKKNHPVNAEFLGEYNVKYIVSPYELDINAAFLEKYAGYYLYRNPKFQPRTDATIKYYSPNKVVIDTNNYNKPNVIFSEVYNSEWKAYINGNKEVPVLQTPNALILVNIDKNTKKIILTYQPDTYIFGRAITETTLALGVIITFNTLKNKKRDSY